MSRPPNDEPRPPYVRQKCLLDGCDRMEELVAGRYCGGLCAGHRRRKNRKLPLAVPLHEGLARRMSPRQALLEAALSFVDAPTDGISATEARRPMERLTHAAQVYADAVRRNHESLSAARRRNSKRGKR